MLLKGELKAGEDYSALEPKALVRHREGDSQAFAQLLAEYGPRIKAYVARSGVEHSSHDDLFQEIFVKVHTMAERYEAALPFEPWLFTIAANTVRSHYRKRNIRAKILGEKAEVEGVEQPKAEELASASQTVKWLDAELHKLSFAQRQSVLLCCIQDFSIKDAASILSLPENTLKTHLRRARLKLAEAVAQRAGTHDEELAS